MVRCVGHHCEGRAAWLVAPILFVRLARRSVTSEKMDLMRCTTGGCFAIRFATVALVLLSLAANAVAQERPSGETSAALTVGDLRNPRLVQSKQAMVNHAPQIRRPDVVKAAADSVRSERSQQASAQTPNSNRRWLKWLLIGAGAMVAWILLSRSLVPYT